MGHPKPLVRLQGRPLIDRVLSTVRRSHAKDVIVVLGLEADRIRREIDFHDVKVVVNEGYAGGMSSSLAAGVRGAGHHGGAYLVVLADQPLVSPHTLDALIERWSATGAKICIPTYHRARGNPVLVDASLSEEMLGITGDRGCRAIFPHHADETEEVPVNDPGILVDLDTEDQVARAEAALERGESLEALAAELGPTRGDLHGRAVPRTALHSLRATVDVLAMAQDLRARNESFALATVVRVVRPTSGKPGNKAIVTPSKELLGWVGGSCAESVVIAESLAAMRDGRPRLLRLSRDPGNAAPTEGVVEYAMECHSGGAMDIYIEPHVPKPQLLIVGDSPVAAALASLGRLMDYRVVVVAPGADRDAFPDADEIVVDLEKVGPHALPGCYAVVATMGKYDEAALRTLATSAAAYLGLVASKRRAVVVLEELREAGVPEENLKHIRSPAGLDLSAETPEEIGLSIMAEITKARRAAPRDLPVASAPLLARAEGVAIDPVCGMEVERTTPLKVHYTGRDYLFCSESCMARFRKNPKAFVS